MYDGDLVAMLLKDGRMSDDGAAVFRELQVIAPAEILPVYCGEHPNQPAGSKRVKGRMSVVVGEAMPADSTLEEIQSALARLGK